jgi:hypothetical protein
MALGIRNINPYWFIASVAVWGANMTHRASTNHFPHPWRVLRGISSLVIVDVAMDLASLCDPDQKVLHPAHIACHHLGRRYRTTLMDAERSFVAGKQFVHRLDSSTRLEQLECMAKPGWQGIQEMAQSR